MEWISLFRQTLAARKKQPLWVSVALAAAGFILLGLGQWSTLQQWVSGLPSFWQAFLGLPHGWLGMAGFGWVFPLLLGWFAIRQGAALIAGEEERGALALLLVGIVRPAQLVWIRWSVLLALSLAPVAALGLALLLGGALGWHGWPGGSLMGTLLSLWLIGVFCGSAALLGGCLSGRVRVAWLAGGLALGLSLLLDRFSAAIPGLGFLHYASPYGWYGGPRLGGGAWSWGWALLAGIALAAAFASAVGFARRDLQV
ncbi:MAG: hypothetical protein JW987_13780 [Anaerolineaceae bacterium]|nr:hypothetical protein [Anaerolineaceae bacterium]